MIKSTIALAAMLLLLCLACKHRSSSSATSDSLTNEKIEAQNVAVAEEKPAPPPPRAPLPAQMETQNFTPPVIGKDEDIMKDKAFNTEDYDHLVENSFQSPLQHPLSTFSIDVDRASYSNVRRFLQNGSLPPAGAVRIEEMINYFDYHYPAPTGDAPFSISTEVAGCPWNEQHKLVQIGLKGKEMPVADLPPSNLVFLIDVSGSMQDWNKLPLVKTSLQMLTNQLREKDRVAIVVYAGNAGLVLPSTSGAEKDRINKAIENLEAGGSTAGGEGISLAYKVASENFIKEGNNRVLLATDGDFNVGPSSDDEMVRLIEKEREKGIFLSVLGFGMGNYKDSKMQLLADKGNGNHAYIDSRNEATKVLVNEFGGTLFTIVKDVKIQVEFNPAKVQAYRLIGYENRVLAAEDFNDDKKDAGEIGSGHTVTALYEIIPAGANDDFTRSVDNLKYSVPNTVAQAKTNELLTVKFRYKKPDEEKSSLLVHTRDDDNKPFGSASENFRFAAAVAEFGLLLRNSAFKQNSSYQQLSAIAKPAVGEDKNGYRKEFIELVRTAEKIGSR